MRFALYLVLVGMIAVSGALAQDEAVPAETPAPAADVAGEPAGEPSTEATTATTATTPEVAPEEVAPAEEAAPAPAE
jgi:hypothetical protein